jgi:hypothetical protein
MSLLFTLQFYWFVGHIVILLSTIAYSLIYINFQSLSRAAEIAYRTHFVAVVYVYGLVAYKGSVAASLAKGSPDTRNGSSYGFKMKMCTI